MCGAVSSKFQRELKRHFCDRSAQPILVGVSPGLALAGANERHSLGKRGLGRRNCLAAESTNTVEMCRGSYSLTSHRFQRGGAKKGLRSLGNSG